ncbi:RsmB/NOP family class I SAM-dependent RNA methyltransferase [Candidatus Uhrbacteria bacterium]|nr:RsmB/NOP family class I SAM-dependent RNA methyltransferase [Candidatus Uhrbacteria bacterium]
MLPQAFIDRLAAQFGVSGKEAILRAFAVDRNPTFRTNTLKATDEKVMEVLREARAQFARSKEIPHAFSVRNMTDDEVLALPLAKEGNIYVQGLTSMLPPLILAPNPNETVLDLCAAPGSKTSQLAALMGNAGKIVACEENSVRYQKLMNTIRVQGASCVDARNIDATLLHHEMPEVFDKILADVPCSAEGRIRLGDKRSYGFWSEKNIVAHAKLQRRLLRSAVACLKPGGTLVYSTCTLAPEENEGMVDWILAEYPFMKAEPVALPFSPITQHKNGSVTLLPSAVAEGFFVAKLRKVAK